MTASPREGGRRPGPRERLLLGLAHLVLWWEDMWPRLMPLASVVAVFLGVALLDLLAHLPLWLHAFVLLGFLLAAGAAFIRIPSHRGIGDAAVRRRLERDSGLDDRPLSALADRLAGGANDPAAEALWRLHLARAAQRARGVRVRLPSPGVAARDPWAFRIAAALFLIVGIVVGHRNPMERLSRAILPSEALVSVAAHVDMWITPPAYTGAPPVYLSGAASAKTGRTLDVPQGSKVLVQVSGMSRPPTLQLAGAHTPFVAIGGAGRRAGYRAETVVQAGGTLEVVGGRGRMFARYPVHVIVDKPPEVAFAKPPQAIEGGRLRLPYKVRDDHGVSRLDLVVERTKGKQAVFSLAPPTGTPQQDGWARGAAVRDTSANRWAGLPVRLWLRATDGLGQTARSDVVSMTLPERTFHHPVARELAEVRKGLSDPSSGARARAIERLGKTLAKPSAFDNSMAIYLGVATAERRLGLEPGAAARHAVQDLLWDMALALEDGGLSLAERDVERIKRQLDAALAADPGSKRTEALLDQLQAAMKRYLSAIAQKLHDRGMSVDMAAPSGDALGSRQLRDLIEKARDLARAGDRQGAERMLAQLSKMLESLRSGMNKMPGKAEVEKARRMLGALRGLSQRQADLNRKTFDAVRAREDENMRSALPHPNPNAYRDKARGQHALEKDLERLSGQMKELLGAVPTDMKSAAEAMHRATGALGAGLGREGLAAQGEAVEALRRSLSQASEQMVRRLGGLTLGRTGLGMLGQNPNDPFGRGGGTGVGGVGSSGVKVPTKAQRDRVRAIEDELRRRAGEQGRPARERDYINRLLKRF